MLTAAAIFILALTMLMGILTNKSDINGLRLQLDAVKDSNHRDALEIMRQMTALHERVAIVESKQTS